MVENRPSDWPIIGWPCKPACARGPVDSFTFFALDQVDGSHGKSSLDEQRREHLEMWTLMGDPALRMPTPAAPIQLESSAAVTPGKEISVSGALPPSINSATVRLTLERPLGSVPIGLASVPSDPQQAQAVIRANHERANNLVLDAQTVEASGGHFTAQIKTPAEIPWSKLIVRAMAESKDQKALGTLSIPIGK